MHKHRIIATVVLACSWLCSATHADDWPQWLGPQRDGVWRETGIVERFPDDGPKVRWRCEIGSGYAGPAVAKGRVYVADRVVDPNANVKAPEKPDSWSRTEIPGKERLVCLRETDGEVLWTHEYDCPYDIAYLYAIGPRATPTVDGNRVYMLGAVGNLTCLDTRDGEVVWKRDFRRDYGLKSPVWGWASHPLIDGEKLICIVGGKGTTAVAYDKRTGKELWRSLTSKEPGYSSPMIYDFGDHRQLFIWHGEAICSLDPESGKVYWTIPTDASFGMSVATPRVLDNRMYLMGYRDFGAMIRLDPAKRTAEPAWYVDRRHGMIGAMDTPFLLDGHIYADGKNGRYTCADLETGEQRWTSYAPSTGDRPAIFANVFTIRHQDRFVLINELGDLILARMSPEGYDEISRAHVIEPTHRALGRMLVWSHPAFANKSVYYRNDKEIVCVSMAAE